MTNKEIIDFYNKGYSIGFITNLYYNNKNSKIKNNYWQNGSYIISKKEITKKDAKNYIQEIIYNYIKKEV